ncbi:MAG: hypothetical protein U9Q34_01700 [Elusimicrobiota bacterium]|nr:hypothetical protein [Elusimicrobiota bacterium]
MKKIHLLIMVFCFLAACAADKSEEVKKEISSDEETVEVTTNKKRADSLLHAPGNYIRTTVGQIDKAKKATAVYEKSALEHMDASESTGE